MIKPRYGKIQRDGWNKVISFIKDRKELKEWLKDGRLQEGDFLVEFKTKYQVVKWKDGKRLIEEIT